MEDGGAQTHILTLAKSLLLRGYSVTVASSGGRLTEQLCALKIPHVTLPPCRLSHLPQTRRILGILCRRKPFDCIHAHARFPALAANRIARRYNIPMVVTAHAHFRVDPIRRFLSRWGTRTIAVSEDLRQYLCEEYGVGTERITVIPNGIECPTQAILPRSDKPRLVFCSRLDRDCSDVAFLLCRIAMRLRATFPTLEILFIGGGSELEKLKHEISNVHKLCQTPFLFCTGSVAQPITHMRPSDVFVGVSRAALEAMSVGVPVILAGNEGFLGILHEDKLALAASTNFCCRGLKKADENKLFQSCVTLLSYPIEERISLGKCLSEYVQAHHSIDAVAEKTAAVYQESISRRSGSKSKNLILCGYYGYGNLGDDTLLQAAIVRAERQYPSHVITVLTARTPKAPFLGVHFVRRTSPYSLLMALRKADLLVFGGGTLLQDATSLRSLLYYAAILHYAHAKGARCELWANGLSRPHSALAEQVMRSTLSRCEHIGLRDSYSIKLAKVLGVNQKKTVREDDLALGLLPAEQGRIDYLIQRYRLQRRFCIVAPKGYADQALISRLKKHLDAIRADGIAILFVEFFPKEDRSLCHSLAHQGDSIAQNLSAQDLIGLMKQSVGVCGMRLHALIFAHNAGVPFIGFGKDEKLVSFCAEQHAPCICR